MLQGTSEDLEVVLPSEERNCYAVTTFFVSAVVCVLVLSN